MWINRINLLVFLGFPGGSDSKEFTCNARGLGSVPGLGRSPGEGMTTHSDILAWRIPWTEEPGRLDSMGLQRVWHDGMTNIHNDLQVKVQNHNYVCINLIVSDTALKILCASPSHLSSPLPLGSSWVWFFFFFFYCLRSFAFSKMSCDWNHIGCSFFILASFTY